MNRDTADAALKGDVGPFKALLIRGKNVLLRLVALSLQLRIKV
jgi:hypothetical protein